MAEFSPQAQAVMDAVNCADNGEQYGLDVFYRAMGAAALRAAADQVVRATQSRTPEGAKQREIRRELLAIAAELEGAD
jgi:hypothetical protein